MKRNPVTVAAGTLALALTMPMSAATAHARNDPGSEGPEVIASGLNNPRHLHWSADGSLIVAEAGRGGLAPGSQTPPENCLPSPIPGEGPVCPGNTGSITTIGRLWSKHPDVHRVVEGLPSTAGPNGSFALGTNGADGLEEDLRGEYLVATLPHGFPRADGGQGVFYAADTRDPDLADPPGDLATGGDVAFSLVNLFEIEAAENPGGLQVDSNPYDIVFVDPTPKGPSGEDGYALVADAGANAVWKVEHDHDAELPEGCSAEEPPADLDPADCVATRTTVFASFPDSPPPAEGEARTPEFVPTSLAVDAAERYVYVGGLGSVAPGAGQVVKFDLATGDEVARWGGFTGVTGVAVTGNVLYVSQLFGSAAPLPEGDTPDDEAPPTAGVPGSVVRLLTHRADSPRWEWDVPLPAGLAVGRGGVYVAVNSVAAAEGIPADQNPFGAAVEGGAVWRLDRTPDRRLPAS